MADRLHESVDPGRNSLMKKTCAIAIVETIPARVPIPSLS
jgi:hypothetical protein